MEFDFFMCITNTSVLLEYGDTLEVIKLINEIVVVLDYLNS